jgi:hypothetical protein
MPDELLRVRRVDQDEGADLLGMIYRILARGCGT